MACIVCLCAAVMISSLFAVSTRLIYEFVFSFFFSYFKVTHQRFCINNVMQVTMLFHINQKREPSWNRVISERRRTLGELPSDPGGGGDSIYKKGSAARREF